MLWVGVADVNSALTFGGRLEGALLVGAAAVIIAAAVAAPVHHLGSAPAGSVLMAGGFVSALVVSILLVLELVQPFRRPVLLYFTVATLVLVGWAAARAHRTGARIPYPRSVAASVLLPAIIALVNIFYVDVYEPSVQPRDLVISGSISTASQSADHGSAFIPVTVDLRNTSKHKLYVLLSAYSVVSEQQTESSGPSRARLQQRIAENRSYSADVDTVRYSLLQTGRVMSFATLEPGATRSTTRLVTVKTPVQDQAVAVYASAFILRADQATVAGNPDASAAKSWDRSLDTPRWVFPNWVERSAVDLVRFRAPIQEASRLKQVLNRRQYLTTWFVAAPPDPTYPPGTYLVGDISSGGVETRQPSDAKFERLAQRYGFALSTLFSTERSVGELGLGSPAPLAVSEQPGQAASPPATPSSSPPASDAERGTSLGGAGAVPPSGLVFTGRPVRRLALEGLAFAALGLALTLLSGVAAPRRRVR